MFVKIEALGKFKNLARGILKVKDKKNICLSKGGPPNKTKSLVYQKPLWWVIYIFYLPTLPEDGKETKENGERRKEWSRNKLKYVFKIL